MEHDHEELRSEVHELRSLNQRLRTDLERFEDPPYAVRHLVGRLVRPIHLAVLRTGGRVLRALGLRKRNGYAGDFRPYVARPKNPAAGSRPRVLHAVANFRTGGSARLVVDLVEQLGHEYEQRVIIRQQPPVQAYEGVAVDAFPDLTSSRPLRRLFARFQPDIVHVHYVADHLREWSERDYRWYIHVFEAAERAGRTVIENVNIPTEPFRSPAVARYVFVSDYVRRRYARPDDATAVVYPGSDLAHFSRGDVERPSQTIGMVYRLDRDKLDEASFDPVVEALSRRGEARAIVVGGGQLLPVYERAAAEAGVRDRVTFTGYVAYDDLPEWYGRMAAFAAPVHNESFGHVSVLAMGMELPVAGYDVGALGEIVGDPRLLAPLGDANALADILVRLLDDPEGSRELGRSNRRRAEENFSVERMGEAYESIYADCLPAVEQ